MNLSFPQFSHKKTQPGGLFQIRRGSNGALVTCCNGRSETLIYVVFGEDFIAGLRVDRRTWILLPSKAVADVIFKQLGASWLPAVRQVNQDSQEYLQGLGSVELRVWPSGQQQPLPASRGTVEGRWLVLQAPGEEWTDRLVSFDSISLVEVADVRQVIGDLQSAKETA
jgi:hypothetical protein